LSYKVRTRAPNVKQLRAGVTVATGNQRKTVGLLACVVGHRGDQTALVWTMSAVRAAADFLVAAMTRLWRHPTHSRFPTGAITDLFR